VDALQWRIMCVICLFSACFNPRRMWRCCWCGVYLTKQNNSWLINVTAHLSLAVIRWFDSAVNRNDGEGISNNCGNVSGGVRVF
jgi:hypothetical protein